MNSRAPITRSRRNWRPPIHNTKTSNAINYQHQVKSEQDGFRWLGTGATDTTDRPGLLFWAQSTSITHIATIQPHLLAFLPENLQPFRILTARLRIRHTASPRPAMTRWSAPSLSSLLMAVTRQTMCQRPMLETSPPSPIRREQREKTRRNNPARLMQENRRLLRPLWPPDHRSARLRRSRQSRAATFCRTFPASHCGLCDQH